MSYLTPPFVVLTASAWVPPGPGADGSLKGNAVAGAVELEAEVLGGVVDGVLVPPDEPGTVVGLFAGGAGAVVL